MLQKIFIKILIFLLKIYITNCLLNKRSIVFPRGSSFGYLAAIATPLDLPHRNVFLSFNFEANYGLPWNQTHKDLIDRWNLETKNTISPNNVTLVNFRNARNIYTRKNFYSSILGYLKKFQSSELCLLKIICEISESPLHINNGLLGSLLKVLFLPSTSSDETIPDEFYDAEHNGLEGNCKKYLCPHNMLDLISKFI